MKKTLVLILSVLLVFTLSTAVFAADDVDVYTGEGNVRTWVCWVQDGNELTVNKVTSNDNYIVKDLSSNWEIKQQNSQTKITDTYWSPATVWTINTAQPFELAFDVFGGTKVEIGFLHCIGTAGSGVNLPCSADGHELVQWCKLLESADGQTWTEVDSDILPAADALVSGMTGYDAADIHPFNGDGVAEYSEAYFVISGTVSNSAKYVKYSFAGNGRTHYWDPCVRDAIFTAPADKVWEPDENDNSEPEPEEYNPWVDLALNCKYEVLSGDIREGDYGDTDFVDLTDGFWSVYGSDGIGALNSPTGSIVLDFGKEVSISKVAADLWYGAWGITEPVSISYYYSTNGTDYTLLGTVENANAEALSGDEFSGYLYTLLLDEPVAMKYLRVDYNGTSHVWTSEIGAYEYVPEPTGESEAESSAPVAESSETGTPGTGDAGVVALAIVSVIALAGAVVIKRK